MAANNLRPWSWTRQTVQAPGEIPIKKGCFSILVTNIDGVGGTVAFVDGYPINPALAAGANGESWNVGGPEGTCISKTTLEIRFAGAGGGNVFVQQVFYTDLE